MNAWEVRRSGGTEVALLLAAMIAVGALVGYLFATLPAMAFVVMAVALAETVREAGR